MHKLRLTLMVGLLAVATSAQAQFKDKAPEKGSRLGAAVTHKIKIGMEVVAEGATCINLIATMPIPADWPEQKVTVVDEEKSSTVQNLRYRVTGGSLRQMVVEVPYLPAGQEARAVVTFEVEHSAQLPPEDTSKYTVPKKLDRLMIPYIGSSPMIESRHAKIVSLAKKLVADKETAWQQVEAIYDWVQENVKVVEGEVKGAARTLNDKTGDAEDIASLFIALCRANKIPARTVWVQNHCYAEFYLIDEDKNGHWFPCQSRGSKSFGAIDETRPILLKGDNFKDPERPRERFRFVPEFIKGSGKGRPKMSFIRETVGG